MRLLVCGPGHPYRGGIPRTTTELVQALVARGHEVRFLTPTRQYPSWLYPGADDRDPRACQQLAVARACFDPFAPASWPAARCLAIDFAADAWVFPYWTWAWSPWWRYLLQGHLRPPEIAVVHNPADHDGGVLPRAAARVVLSRCRALFTHAWVLAETLRSTYPGVAVAAHPLPADRGSLPARAAARQALGLPADARVALFFGLIRPYKGVDLLLEAFARIAAEHDDWHLVIAGEPWGGLGRELEQRVAALGLGGRVVLRLEWVPEEETATLLAAADVVTLPYRSGSQSAVAPAAMAHGIPVVCSAVGGLPEVVEHDRSGLLVPPGSAESLAAALASLDRERIQRLAQGAQTAAGGLRWSGYAGALEGLIRGVL